jgi:hypothetical protein
MAKMLLVESYYHQRRWAATVTVIDEVAPMINLAMFGNPQTALLDFYRAASEWELGHDRPASLRAAREAYARLLADPKSEKPTLAMFRTWLAGK